MGRFEDFLLLLVWLVILLVVQLGSAPITDDLRNEFNENPASGNINQQSINDEMYTAVVKWVPTIALIGPFLVVGYREYRRQRITQVRRRRL